MNRERFYHYILENFTVDGATARLIYNILLFIEKNYPGEYEQQHDVLDEILSGTIGLTREEIKQVCM